MGLLNVEERRELERLLLAHPDVTLPELREALLANLPHAVRIRVPEGRVVRYQIGAIIGVLDGSVDLDNAQLADGSWPLLVLLDNASGLFAGLASAPTIEALRARAAERAIGRTLRAPAADRTVERLVNARASFTDPQVALRALAQAMRAVCKVEAPGAVGTGFLLAPDLVLTCDHVVEGVAAADVRLRFDYLHAAPGQPEPAGTLHTLAAEAIVCRSPQAALDFALLRLAAPLARHPASGAEGIDGHTWLVPADASLQLAPDTPLFILQHPDGRRLEAAYGWVVAEPAAPGRVRYRTNTEFGSSGAPCFNEHWRLVAFHQAGAATANEGLPIRTLLALPEVQAALAQRTES